jgi:hypothetical protein
MIAAPVDTPTQITLVVAIFFLLLALIAVARSMFRSDDPPEARRFRVGVFVERDHEREPSSDDTSSTDT